MEMGVGQRQRLDRDVAAGFLEHSGEQRRLERLDAVAVGRSAFGEQDQGVSRLEATGHFVGDLVDGGASRTVDEDGALQPGKARHEGPRSDFSLGNEREGGDGAQHRDVEPGDVVGDDEHGTPLGDAAVDVETYAEQAADGAVVPVRQATRAFRRHPEEKVLHRHQRQRQAHEGGEDQCRAQRAGAGQLDLPTRRCFAVLGF